MFQGRPLSIVIQLLGAVMRLLVTFTLALAVSAGAFAEPPVIDFVGLVPGVSTEADYDATLAACRT